jgi:hypothetical protein
MGAAASSFSGKPNLEGMRALVARYEALKAADISLSSTELYDALEQVLPILRFTSVVVQHLVHIGAEPVGVLLQPHPRPGFWLRFRLRAALPHRRIIRRGACYSHLGIGCRRL